jgi:hypothetical protein
MFQEALQQFGLKRRLLIAALALICAVALCGSLDLSGSPQSLLNGAKTIVPASYNAALGFTDANNPVRSQVTGIRFHIPGVSSHVQVSTTPIGVHYIEHGVEYTEYSGELSGYAFASSVTGMSFAGYFRYVYGSIDEDGVDHSHDADPGNFTQKTTSDGLLVFLDRYGEEVLYDSTSDAWFLSNSPISPWEYLPFIPVATELMHERFGIRGVNFILRVPKVWNGKLVHYMHGGGLYWDTDSGFFKIFNFDENLLLDRGYALLSINGSGRTPDNSNYRMEPAIQNYYAYMVSPLNEKPEARVAEGYSVNGIRPCRGMNDEPMALRDISVVFSNLLKSITGKEVKRKYYSTWSHSGGAAGLALSWGVTWGGLHFGGNHRTPYQNNSEPIYDGFIHFDPSYWNTYYLDPDPDVPMSPAPMMIFAGSNSMMDVPPVDQISLTGALFAKKSHEAGNPTKNTIFFYTMENLPHVGADCIFATEKNGGGWFFDETTLSVNQIGVGREMGNFASKLVDILGPQGFIDSGFIYWAFLTKDAPRGAGLYFQLLNNLDLYLEKGVKPPPSIIDPYWIKGGSTNPWPRNPWPEESKFPLEPMSSSAQDTAIEGHYNLFDRWPQYAGVADYIRDNDVLNYRSEAVRLPDDAARRGIYLTDENVEIYALQFSNNDLKYGYQTLDWNGEELITLRMPNGAKIPGDGYGSHGGYVSAVAHAVHSLVSARLFDSYLGARLIEEAAKSDVLKKSP